MKQPNFRPLMHRGCHLLGLIGFQCNMLETPKWLTLKFEW
jgi:hypothetical protein